MPALFFALPQVEEEDLDPLRPLVPQLLQQFLTLSNEVGCGRLAGQRRGGWACGAAARWLGSGVAFVEQS